MKVLHIGKYFAPFKGGVESYLRDLMTGQQRAGLTCAALVHNHRLSLRSHQLFLCLPPGLFHRR